MFFSILKDLFWLYFRLRGSAWVEMKFLQPKYHKYRFLLPPAWYNKIWCLFGKHNWDLCYSGPESSGLACNDCFLETHSLIKDGIITTRTFRPTKDGTPFKMITETREVCAGKEND